MYGQYYTPQTVSSIASAVKKQVEEFHSRKVSQRYASVYCDATYLNLRRDSVAKEALHVILGITTDGHKEVWNMLYILQNQLPIMKIFYVSYKPVA